MILGEKWTIKTQKEVKGDNNDIVMGTCDKAIRTIYIDSDLDIESHNITFFHELCHAVLSESCLNETSLHEDIEEIIVEQIAKFLVKNFNIKPKGD